MAAPSLSTGDVYQYCSSFSRENDAQNNALNCDTTSSSTKLTKKTGTVLNILYYLIQYCFCVLVYRCAQYC